MQVLSWILEYGCRREAEILEAYSPEFNEGKNSNFEG